MLLVYFLTLSVKISFNIFNSSILSPISDLVPGSLVSILVNFCAAVHNYSSGITSGILNLLLLVQINVSVVTVPPMPGM